jgi:filamentous hemagglutinin
MVNTILMKHASSGTPDSTDIVEGELLIHTHASDADGRKLYFGDSADALRTFKISGFDNDANFVILGTTSSTALAGNTTTISGGQASAITANTSKTTNATHDGDAAGSGTLTFATVNSNVGSFTNADITVNAKGLVTAAADGSGGGSDAFTLKVDSGATAGYLGVAYSDGILRTTQNEIDVVDGGNYITLGLSDHDTARTALGLAIGSDVQAYDTQLAALAGVSVTNTTAVGNLTGTNTGDNTVCTSGAATTAAALLTGRTFLCDVGETDASTAFTGAANCTDIGVTGLLPVGNGGTGKNAGYNYSEWDTAYDNSVTGISDSGSSTITLTLTQQDSGTLTTSFSNPQGTVTSIAAGAGFSFSTITGSGTIAVDGHLQDLDALGAVSSTVDQFMVSTGAGAWAYETPSTVRSTLNVANGSTANAGTVTSVATAGTENGLTLTGGSITSSGTITLGGTLAINNGDWSGTDLSVANGGTGASTLTANGVLIGNGTSAISAVDMSTKGHILVGDGSGNPRMLAVGGTNDHVLTVASGETTGVKWAAVSGGGGSGDVVAGSTFTTAGVIMACNGDDKEIDAPGTTLTTNSQGMTVGGALTCTGAFTLGSSVSLDENATWGTISGTAFQLGKEDATYMYDIHSGYTGSVAITTTSNYFHVKPELLAGVGAIPVNLPDGSSEEGLTITIVNDCGNNPAGALTVSPQGSDVIYDGASNSTVSSVSIAAFRGANKTFVTIEDGIWIVMA